MNVRRPSRQWVLLGLCCAVGCGGDPSAPDTESSAGAGGIGGGATEAGGGLASGASGGTPASAGSSGSGGGAGAAGGKGGVPADDAGTPATDGSGGGHASKSPFDWVGVVGTGQSLSQGWESTAISTKQTFKNLKLVDQGADPKYPIVDSPSAKWSAIPLTEPIRMAVPGTGPGYGDYQYPDNIWNVGDTYGETPHSGMANMISLLWQTRGLGDYVGAHTVVGFGGAGIKDISKGCRGYLAALNEARVFKGLAAAAGKTYGVAGIILTHGETDSTNPTYGASLYKLWQDYNADLKAVTGQSQDLVMFASQQSSSAPGANGSQVQLWRAGVDHPTQIVCTGPKYQYGVYGLHMPAPSYERLGQKYGEVFDRVINQGASWKPLGPKNISRVGAVITVELDVPNPPLAWDAHLIPPHQALHTAWSKGHGFEVIDGANRELAIASAEISGNTVVLTLSETPAANAKLSVSYAVTQDATDQFPQGGTDLGPHGQLRDSDELVGYDAESIDVQVTAASTTLAGPQASFARRAPHDIVEGDGVPSDTIVTTAAPWGLTLSRPWPGATGTVKLKFRHDMHNYCVHFSMAVL